MGVTAHRIDMVEATGPAGSRTLLQLRSYLIGFHCIPGQHSGEHLAQLLIYILDRLGIISKVSNVQLRCL